VDDWFDTPRKFRDRRDAGRHLAERLHDYRGRDDAIVLALPRGGVPVGYEVANELNLPLDVFVVRKLGVPGHEELAMGAIASGGTRVLDKRVVDELGIDEETIATVAAEEQRCLEDRERRYRGDRPPPDVTGKTALVLDDGLATGSSMRAAVEALRGGDPAEIVIAVPVAPPETCSALRETADDVVCGVTPDLFMSVGSWYRDFSQTTDEEVAELLRRAREELQEPTHAR
jgi:predicted phosphoribosyltransferase